jgi:hypothetical protein
LKIQTAENGNYGTLKLLKMEVMGNENFGKIKIVKNRNSGKFLL